LIAILIHGNLECFVKTFFKMIGLILLTLAVPALSYAYGWVQVPDASLLSYQLSPDGKVYFRNLNQFSSTALGCCYNYYIDTNTQHGRNIYALFLSKQAQGKRIIFSVPDNGVAGAIDYVGEW